MSFYQDYKPFRNFMRRFKTLPTLIALWSYARHVFDGESLPRGLPIGLPQSLAPLNTHFYPWELEILVRETLLHADPAGGELDLRQWLPLAKAINHIRRLDDRLSVHTDGPALLLELNRMAHRQFRWQERQDLAWIARIYKIYARESIDRLVQSELGMSTRQVVLFGSHIAGNFIARHSLPTTLDYTSFGISREAAEGMFEKVTCDVSQLRTQLREQQSYDPAWLYTWNPLEQRPLIRVDPARPDEVICPIPKYALRRLTTGIFYDLIPAKGFDHLYGEAFQRYIGEVCSVSCPPPLFTLRAEQAYQVGKGERHDGIDWVLSDAGGHLLIECKTKRMALGSKMLTNPDSLEKDLLALARAVVQTYKNTQDVINGRAGWSRGALPVYPLIVTLDEWYMLGPHLRETLHEKIQRLLEEAGLSPTLLIEMPLTIASVREFEFAVQVIAHVGVSGLMKEKTAPEHHSAHLFPFLQTQFPTQLRHAKSALFAEEAMAWVTQTPGGPALVPSR
jgi:hypothetical protein